MLETERFPAGHLNRVILGAVGSVRVESVWKANPAEINNPRIGLPITRRIP